MSTYQSPIIVGVFERESDAKRAIDDLRNAGFEKDQLGFALRESGAVTANLRDDLANLGVPADRAEYYHQQYQENRPVVSVRADGREREAAGILSRNGASGVNDTQSGYTSDRDARVNTTNASTYDNTNAAYRDANAATGNDAAYADSNRSDIAGQERRSMPLREEQLEVNKERMQAGEVRLHKDVVEEQRNIDVPVTHEEVYVQRRDVNPRASDTTIGQDESIRVPVSEEQVNVNKNTVTTGEVQVGKRAVTENQQVTDTVRREEARLDRSGDPRIQTNDDAWANNNTTDRETRRDDI